MEKKSKGINYTSIKFVKQEFPARFRRPLTKEDCKKGFHLFDQAGEDENYLYEKCSTCGIVEQYFKVGLESLVLKKKWGNSHKLDILQPSGKTKKDFIEYYGDPFVR